MVTVVTTVTVVTVVTKWQVILVTDVTGYLGHFFMEVQIAVTNTYIYSQKA